MVLCGDILGSHTRPGQFVNLQMEGCYLRRPHLGLQCGDATASRLIYKVVGRGTESHGPHDSPANSWIVLTGLGNGFDAGPLRGPARCWSAAAWAFRRMYAAGKQADRRRRKSPAVVLGFNTTDEVFYAEEFEALGAKSRCATADGSCGTCGLCDRCYEAV